MKFTVLDVNVAHDSDADYETAVEIVRSSIVETDVRLQTEAGLVLKLSDCQIHSTYSYMEPDFDQMENGGPTVYATHPNARPAKHSRHLKGSAVLEPELPALSAEDWKFYEDLEDSAGWHEDINEMPDSVRRNLLSLDNYRESLSEGISGKALLPAFVQRLMDALPEGLEVSQVVELPLTPAEEVVLNQVAAVAAERAAANRQTAAHNQISRNVAHAKADIAETVEGIRHRFKMR